MEKEFRKKSLEGKVWKEKFARKSCGGKFGGRVLEVSFRGKVFEEKM